MKVVVIEDEKPAARRLLRMLEQHQIEVVTMLHSVTDSIEWFQNNEHPDLIFLDIQLSDGLSFEIFESVTITSAIIFTTAYDSYALKAFKLNSVDYLLKPIDEDELHSAIDKYKRTQVKDQSLDISQLKQLLGVEKQEYKSRFSVKVGQHLKIIPIEEIECFISENKATYLVTKDNRSYLIDETLEQLENELNPSQFFRVNRQYIIQLSAIKDIVYYTNSRLTVHLNSYKEDAIIVSRERVKSFKSWIA